MNTPKEEQNQMGFLSKMKSLVNHRRTKFTMKELLEYFGKESIMVSFFLLTFITSIPLPPWGGGLETIPGGLVCIILAIQGILGLPSVYVPRFIQELEIDIGFVQKSETVNAMFGFIEEYMTPNRHTYVFNVFTEKLVYLLIIPHALLMILPIVFTNGPPSQSISLLSLAWLLQDGLLLLTFMGLSVFVVLAYIFLFFWFGKFLYKTRQTWTFGLWQ